MIALCFTYYLHKETLLFNSNYDGVFDIACEVYDGIMTSFTLPLVVTPIFLFDSFLRY